MTSGSMTNAGRTTEGEPKRATGSRETTIDEGQGRTTASREGMAKIKRASLSPITPKPNSKQGFHGTRYLKEFLSKMIEIGSKP